MHPALSQSGDHDSHPGISPGIFPLSPLNAGIDRKSPTSPTSRVIAVIGKPGHGHNRLRRLSVKRGTTLTCLTSRSMEFTTPKRNTRHGKKRSAWKAWPSIGPSWRPKPRPSGKASGWLDGQLEPRIASLMLRCLKIASSNVAYTNFEGD